MNDGHGHAVVWQVSLTFFDTQKTVIRWFSGPGINSSPIIATNNSDINYSHAVCLASPFNFHCYTEDSNIAVVVQAPSQVL